MVAGIDWAPGAHVACVMSGDGAVASRFSFTHDGAAIRAMAARLRAMGVAGVAIERGDGPVAGGAAQRRTSGLRRGEPPDQGPADPVRAGRELETRVQVLGQLRANPELAFAAAIGLFTRLYSTISLAFLQRFPTAAKASWLSPMRLANWLSSVS